MALFTITGTNNAGVDVPAIQDVLDAGTNNDRVNLSGTFDCGNSSLIVEKDFVIHGVSNCLIRNGHYAISIGGDSRKHWQAPTSTPKVTIHDVRFSNAKATAVSVIGSTRLELKN